MHHQKLWYAFASGNVSFVSSCPGRIGLVNICTSAIVVLSIIAVGEGWALDRYFSSLPSLSFSNERAIADAPLGSTITTTVYLPLVIYPDRFSQNHPIWVHSSAPASHEVVLFRHTFTLDEQLKNTELFIFADTRYEVWMDGIWVGRGPARFSQTTREYDIYQLGELRPGVHLIAVLVQWAPNNRRSESTTPFLQAHILGVTGEGLQVVARTDTRWKALLSDAWQQDAAPVHSWGLIGPTELVDLRRIPSDWMLPAFSDDEWPTAVVRSVPGATYRARSIPFLDNVPITPTVIDAGLLSPGRVVGELVPPVPDAYIFAFNALSTTMLTVEVLSESGASPSNVVWLDDDKLVWEEGGAYRPDVYVASTSIPPGAHTLSFAGIPSQGLTFAISTQDIQFQSEPPPFQQDGHAGRRLLLAEPVSQPDQVTVSSGHGLSLEFMTPPAYAVLDLGRVVHGRLVAEVAGPAGTVVDIGWDERLWLGTRPLPYPGSLHEQWNQTDSWILDGSNRSISTLDARTGRYILVAVWGDSPVQIRNIQVYEERYPVIQRGEFNSSNALLDRIWQVGVDTLYPNMVDAYTDTPWRERGQWWGDAYVEDHINRVSFGDRRLLRRGLLFMAEAFTEGRPKALAPNGNGNHMLDYGMLWVQSLNDYWQLTGDTQLLVDVYPVLSEFMGYLESYENPTTGLLDIPLGHWSETVLIDWAAYSSRYGQSTAVNALYYETLIDAANLADEMGDFASALAWRRKADSVRQQINSYLYLPTEHRYIASIFEGESLPPSPHAQAWALACGLVPEGEVDYVTSSLLELLSPDPSSPNVEIYGMFWALKALGDAGRISEALSIIENYYGRMLNLDATTWWEGFNAHLYYTASLSHGWGGAPTWFLTTYVLGAHQTGSDTWLVKPAFSGVSWASGSLPLQDGALQIYWERQSCENSRLELTSPVNTTGEIIAPFTSATTVLTLNGNVIWRDGIPLADGVTALSDGIHILLEGGVYVLDVRQDCYDTYLPLVIR